MLKQWLLIILALILLNSVYASGIAPAKISISLSPGESRTITFYAINDLNGDAVVEPYASGDLANFIKVNDKKIYLKPKEIKPFQVVLTMPNELKSKYTSYVGVISSSGNINTGLSARIAAESTLEVTNLLDKPAIEIELIVTNQKPVSLQLVLKNPSNVNAEKIRGNIRITDKNFNTLANFRLSEDRLKSLSSVKKIFDFKPANDGEFTATANVDFNGGSASIETNFEVGNKILDITNVIINKKDKIVEIDIEVENKWNADIEASGEVLISQNKNKIETLTTQTAKIAAGQKYNLKAYWETEKNPDDFDFDIIVNYNKKSVKKTIFAKQTQQTGTQQAQQIQKTLSKLTGAFSIFNNINPNLKYAFVTLIFIIMFLLASLIYSRRIKPPKATMINEDYYKKYYERLSKRK